MKTMKCGPFIILAILALSGLFGCKPMGPPAKSSGSSLNGADLPSGTTPAVLIEALQQNGFAVIDGKTFEELVSSAPPSSNYTGVVALRDATVKGRNELVVGVGSDEVYWYESHNASGNEISNWEAHVKTRTDLVKKLAAKKE